MPETLFDVLCRHYRQTPDRHGEVYVTCPYCNSESTRRNPRCSFSEKGFFCFVCGKGASLRGFAQQIGLQPGTPEPVQPRPEPKPEPRPSWMARPEPYVAHFEQHPARFQLWDCYKPLPREVIISKRLGVGVLPSSRCQHERLIVPVMAGTNIVGLRGRQLACQCGKWLVAGGTTIDQMPMYNADALGSGQVVLIVENPVDALMISAYTPYVGVATYSISYWQEAWTKTLRVARPELVVVAYDNDIPGNGGGNRRPQMEREWLARHPGARVCPPARGPILANTLLAAGLPAVLYDWGEASVKDIGGMLSNALVGPQEGRRAVLPSKEVISYGTV